MSMTGQRGKWVYFTVKNRIAVHAGLVRQRPVCGGTWFFEALGEWDMHNTHELLTSNGAGWPRACAVRSSLGSRIASGAGAVRWRMRKAAARFAAARRWSGFDESKRMIKRVGLATFTPSALISGAPAHQPGREWRACGSPSNPLSEGDLRDRVPTTPALIGTCTQQRQGHSAPAPE